MCHGRENKWDHSSLTCVAQLFSRAGGLEEEVASQSRPPHRHRGLPLLSTTSVKAAYPRVPPRTETEHSHDAIIEKDDGGEDAETNRHVWGWMHNR